MLFAGGGYNVYLYDIENSQLTDAKKNIEEQFVRLEENDLLRGKLSAKQQIGLINVSNDLTTCVKDAQHVQVQFDFNEHCNNICQGLLSFPLSLLTNWWNYFVLQECVPENIELKKKVFTQLDGLATEDVVLSSSSSAIPCSKFTENLKHRTQCIVSHPVRTSVAVHCVNQGARKHLEELCPTSI